MYVRLLATRNASASPLPIRTKRQDLDSPYQLPSPVVFPCHASSNSHKTLPVSKDDVEGLCRFQSLHAKSFLMTAFDDDPEYEAQLKEVLGDHMSTWQDDDNNEGQEQMNPTLRDTDDRSEDSVLNDVRSFRMKLPPEASGSANRIDKDDDDVSITDARAMSEDARSISTGDDSPSAQVHTETIYFDSRAPK